MTRLLFLLLLSGCSIISQIKQSNQAIEENRIVIEHSTVSIAENADAVDKSTAVILKNTQMLESVTDKVKNPEFLLPLLALFFFFLLLLLVPIIFQAIQLRKISRLLKK